MFRALLPFQQTPVLISSGFVAHFAFSGSKELQFAVSLVNLWKAPLCLCHCYVFVALFYDKKSW